MLDQWNERFKIDEYAYGEQPNSFIEAHINELRGETRKDLLLETVPADAYDSAIMVFGLK